MRIRSSNIISEVQKVRFMVMDIIYRNSDRSVMIPSSNELAAHFGIARYTVRLALEKMTEEEYLFTKRGTGTFTIPQSIINGSEKLPLIGIRIGFGDQFYYDAPILNTLGTLFRRVARRNYNIRLLTDSADSIADYEQVLDNAYIDALITISVKPEFSRLAAQRIPVVAVGFEAEGVNSIVYGGTKVVDELLKQRKTDTKLTVLSTSKEADLKLFYKDMADCPDIDFICEPVSFRNKNEVTEFEQMISRVMPNILCLRESQASRVRKVLVGMNIAPDCCRLLKLDTSDPRPFKHGMKLDVNLELVLNTAVNEIIRLIDNNGDEKPFRHVIDYSLIFNDNINT